MTGLRATPFRRPQVDLLIRLIHDRPLRPRGVDVAGLPKTLDPVETSTEDDGAPALA